MLGSRSVAKRNPNSIPKPLSYESLKIVLKHFEANKRLDLTRRCDSIRTANKAAPLKIEVLAFEPMKTIINNKSYQLGVYRKFHDKEHDQNYILEGTESGGTPYDLDRFGFREPSEDMKMTLGDVNLQFELLPAKPTVEGSRQNVRNQNLLMAYVRSCYGDDPDAVIDRCRRMRGEILPATYHVKGETPPYNSYILLTVENRDLELHRVEDSDEDDSDEDFDEDSEAESDEDDSKKLNSAKKEHVEYTKTLQEASKYLNTWIFGSRPAIQVKKLEVKSAQMTIRLPPDVKIHAQIIKIHRRVYRTIESLSQILTDSSFPLKAIETFYSEMIGEDFAHENIGGFGKLVIFLDDSFHWFSANTKWNRLPPRTHFGTERIRDGSVILKFIIFIIKNWRASMQQFGTWFSVGYANKWIVSDAMKELAKEFKVAEKNRFLMIPLDATRDVQVWYEKVDHTEYDSYGAYYILNMKVVEK